MRPVSPNAKFHEEHKELIEAVYRLLSILERLNDWLVFPDGIEYGHYRFFTARAISLTSYLRGALALAENDFYPPGFAIIRAAMEHQLIDRLEFLADRYIQKVPMDEAQWDDFRKNIPDRVIECERAENGIVTLHMGRIPAGEGYSFSPYLLLVFGEYISQEEKKQAWRSYLRWESIKSNLLLNNLCSQEYCDQLDVHYRFLSSYTHPMHYDNWRDTYSGKYSGKRFGIGQGYPRYNHYSSELILLYICYISMEEIKDFSKMTTLPPSVAIRGWEDIEQSISSISSMIQYAWFPGMMSSDMVREIDRYITAIRKIDEGKDRSLRFSSITVHDINDDDILYYEDPLNRLKQLHMSVWDIVGSYDSPWPRSDHFA